MWKLLASRACWVQSTLLVPTGCGPSGGHVAHLHGFTTNSTFVRTRYLTCKGKRALHINMSDKRAGDDEGEEDKRDWDESWAKFREKEMESGGVFRLGSERDGMGSGRTGREDGRVERLTDAWSNETGFLAGIGVVALIGVFYAYVFFTGGIQHYN